MDDEPPPPLARSPDDGQRESDSAGPPVSRRGLLAALSAGTAGLAGCRGGSDAGTVSPVPVETTDTPEPPLELLHGWTGGPGRDAVAALTALFAERHPKITLDDRAVSDNYGRVPKRRLESGDPPGSFATRPGATLDRYADSLADLGDVWAETGFADAVPSGLADVCRRAGAPRHCPVYAFRTNVLAYDRSVCEAAGVDPTSLSSVSDLLAALAAVERETEATPLAHATADPWTTLQLWTSVFLAVEGPAAYRTFLAGDGDREAVEAAVAQVGKLLAYAPEDARDSHFLEQTRRVAEGRAAAVPMGSWVFREFVEASPGSYGSGWNWVPFPGSAGQYATVLDGFVVPSENPRPTAAGTWAAFLTGREAQVTASARHWGSVPVRTDVDVDGLPAYAEDLWRELAGADAYVPSLAHGLAVAPERVTACENAVERHVHESFDAAAAADALLAAVSE